MSMISLCAWVLVSWTLCQSVPKQLHFLAVMMNKFKKWDTFSNIHVYFGFRDCKPDGCDSTSVPIYYCCWCCFPNWPKPNCVAVGRNYATFICHRDCGESTAEYCGHSTTEHCGYSTHKTFCLWWNDPHPGTLALSFKEFCVMCSRDSWVALNVFCRWSWCHFKGGSFNFMNAWDLNRLIVFIGCLLTLVGGCIWH